MIEKKKLNNLISWLRDHPDMISDWDEDFAQPFMEAVGDDREGLCNFLRTLSAKNLNVVSGMFEDIYEKWNDDEMWDFLETLEKKLTDKGYEL